MDFTLLIAGVVLAGIALLALTVSVAHGTLPSAWNQVRTWLTGRPLVAAAMLAMLLILLLVTLSPANDLGQRISHFRDVGMVFGALFAGYLAYHRTRIADQQR
ncbi:MAG: hypothetical protein HQL39_17690, partial [Alphaproteobacteria bacterium]|nr:hypothetical protein [Alphaproteobacteria bacterium]